MTHGFRCRPRSAAAVALTAVASTWCAFFAEAAVAATGPGTAVVVDGAGSPHRLNEGGSNTTFSLRLPGGSQCPGDSADRGYRVQSFLVPATDDPGALTYFSVMPVGKGRYALYDVFTNPYIQSLTAKATKQGGPGPIVNIPEFNFGVFPPGVLAPGRYHVGIACSLYNKTARFWSTDIELTRAAADRPAQLHWRALDAARTAHSGSSAWMVALAVALVATVLGVRYGWRRRQPTPPRRSEDARR